MNPETPITDALWERLSIQGWTRGLLPVSTIMESHEQLEHALAAERALADRLADALSDIQAKCCDTSIALHPDADAKGCVDDCWEWSEQALTAWKEARRGAG